MEPARRQRGRYFETIGALSCAMCNKIRLILTSHHHLIDVMMRFWHIRHACVFMCIKIMAFRTSARRSWWYTFKPYTLVTRLFKHLLTAKCNTLFRFMWNDCVAKCINKNIEIHTAHTIVWWPNPKQWIIVHTSDLMVLIRQSAYFVSYYMSVWSLIL